MTSSTLCYVETPFMIGTNARKKLKIGKIFTGLSKAEYQELVGDILHDGLGSYSGRKLKLCTTFAAIIRSSKHFWLLQCI